RRTARAPPGAGGHALEQAVLLLRRRSMASAAQESSAHGIHAAWHPEHRVVSHAERRRDLHAGQVGISLVCGLGSGIPYDFTVAGGFRFRQGPTPAAAAQPLYPPQWAD